MADPDWVSLSDEQLLNVRMCDLGLTIAGQAGVLALARIP